MQHATREELDAALETIRQSPRSAGVVKLIVRRPSIGTREVVEQGELDPAEGLLGDNWDTRGSTRTPDGTSHPEMQLTIMNSRVIAALTQDISAWPLAGDQLYVDMALGDVGTSPHDVPLFRYHPRPLADRRPLGAGGMGEVCKATDTRLHRTVAIKVLPEHVASTLT